MSFFLRSAAFFVTTASFACGPKTPVAAPEPRPTGVGAVEVVVNGFDSDEGQVLIALFLSEAGWPDDETRAFAASVLPITDRRAVAEFRDVPAGAFAVSVFHDADLDRELDTGVFGIPTEDYGFSRDARDTFGPPSFDDARLDVASGERKTIAIKVD